jgi:hypothetical protein
LAKADNVVSCVYPDMVKGRAVVKHESHGIFMVKVRLISLCKVNVGEYVTIYNHEGLLIPEILHVLDASPCPQDGLLEASIDGNAIVLLVDELIDLLGQVVGIDDHGFAACLFEPAN